MFRKKYVNLFPSTFSTKNAETPYNNAALNKPKTPSKEESVESIEEETEVYVGVNDLKNFSADNQDLRNLLNEAAETLRDIIDASGVSTYIVFKASKEIHLLVPKLPIIPPQNKFKIEEGTTVAANVAFNKEYVLVEDLEYDLRFPKGIGFDDQQAHWVMCVPVVTPDGECFAVFEFYKARYDNPFTKDDLKIAIVVTGWMGAAIHQNLQRLSMKSQETLHEFLLGMTRNFFHRQIDTTQVVTDLVSFAKERLNVIRGSFYLIDKDSDELIADVYEESLDPEYTRFVKKNLKYNLVEKDRGIVTTVAKTGVLMNIKDGSVDRRIEKEPEVIKGRTINSLLCMPVSNSKGLLGIFKLVNKRHICFGQADEDIMRIFISYACCCLQFNTMEVRFKKQKRQGNLVIHLLNKMLKPCIHEYEHAVKTIDMRIPHQFHEWYISENMLDNAPQLSIHMVRDLCDKAGFDQDHLINFLLITRRLYRSNPYHNFEHAFNFMHCMYSILRRNTHLFKPLEIKALLIAAICHDIDHGGFTNNFLKITNDEISQLYPESSWENYHYMITAHLLQNIPVYEALTTKKIFLKEIKDAILSTDLQMFFKNRLRLLPLINRDNFEISNPSHKYLLKTLMMTVCDLSGQCKPFEIAKKITYNVYREFYRQGDMEKNLGVVPLSMMDREKEHLIPEDQIQFLSVVVLPATEMLKCILPNTGDLHSECLSLQRSWKDIVDAQNEQEELKSDNVENDENDN